ncbi:MAG: UDP-N-acetylmuramate dehydrogenase [Leptospirales bacterium]|nr:UDP-N-acetylmuramate dehydrogenase [Leptospirales bacterium]
MAEIQVNVPLARYTTIQLGGPAELFVEVADTAGLIDALNVAGARKLPVMILGGGSNVIFPDSGFPGLVIRMASRGWKVEREDNVRGIVEIRAQAGQNWDAFVEYTASQNWFGVECLSGIPGTAAGVPVQNVGAYGQEGKDTIVSVRCLDRSALSKKNQGQILSESDLESLIVEIEAADCGFDYRTSRFKHADAGRFVILDVLFRLNKAPSPARYPELIRAMETKSENNSINESMRRRNAVIGLRKKKSMVLDPADPDSVSCGSFFTNPILSVEQFTAFQAISRAKGLTAPAYPGDSGTKISAAWLVENSGFGRGLTENGAGISSKHALALVNRGTTTSQLLEFAGRIQETVFKEFGVRLEMEPELIKPVS